MYCDGRDSLVHRVPNKVHSPGICSGVLTGGFQYRGIINNKDLVAFPFLSDKDEDWP